MNNILQYSIITIPIIIGVVSGINKKTGTSNKCFKELVTVLVSIFSIFYYIAFVDELNISMVIVMFIVNYFGASGIYQFIPYQKGVIEIPVENIPEFKSIDIAKEIN